MCAPVVVRRSAQTAEGEPGGCDNIRILIGGAGGVHASMFTAADSP